MSRYFKNRRGFTVVELMVSIGIVSVILTIVLLNQSTYTDSADLTHLADEVSLKISQAQAYGTGVREFSSGSGEFGASYGLAFSLLGSGSNSSYVSFADRNNDKIYGGDWSCPVGGVSECLEKTTISQGNVIDSICVVTISGADQCDTASRVDLSFMRPSTEAQLVFFNNGGQEFNPPNMEGVKIIFRSPGGSTRSVTTYTTGQISVQ